MLCEPDPTSVPLCAETGYWEPLRGGERSSHSFCHFPATLLGSELCSLCSLCRGISAMKLPSGCLLHLGEKEQLGDKKQFMFWEGKIKSRPV